MQLSVALFRRGKLRGGKIIPVQADFSAVLDFLDQSTWQSSAVLAAYSEHLHKEVFGLVDHPGLPLYSTQCSALSKVLRFEDRNVDWRTFTSAHGPPTSNGHEFQASM